MPKWNEVLNYQLDNLNTNIVNDNIMVADASYDSSILQSKLAILKFGKIIAARNKRNTKNNKK